ncbi:MAG: hypothetical protein QXF09_04980 [Nitrososphaerota archaeon]
MIKKLILILTFTVLLLISQEIDTVWIKGYNTPDARVSFDVGSSIAIDNSGSNIYIAGSSGLKKLLINYNSQGILKWARSELSVYSGEGAPLGLTYWNTRIYYTVCMTHQSNPIFESQIYTFCYDTLGNRIWGQVFGNQYYLDYPVGLFIDNQGYVYVVGTACFDTTAEDFVLLKYNGNNGNLLWWKRFWSTYDYVLDVTVSAAISRDSNSIFIGGISYKPNVYKRALIVKYSTNGSLIWSIVNQSCSTLIKVLPDYSGNLYVLFSENYLVKYNTSGNLIFEIVLPTIEKINSIFVDENNNFYVTGSIFNFNNSTQDFLLRKYSSNGSILWEKTYDSGMNDEGLIIKGFDNSLFILCESQQGKFFLRYSYNGELLNTSKFYLYEYEIADFVISPTGNEIYSIGSVPIVSSDWPNDIVTVKYGVPLKRRQK